MIKKSHPRFVVPNLGAKRRKRVKDRWRKQRGMDNKKRVYKSGYGAVPNIGYKNSDEVRYMRPDGTRGIVIHNRKELEAASQLKNTSFTFSHALSRKTRMELQKIADSKGMSITNRVKT